jgi:photosystem II Psb27 protein
LFLYLGGKKRKNMPSPARHLAKRTPVCDLVVAIAALATRSSSKCSPAGRAPLGDRNAAARLSLPTRRNAGATMMQPAFAMPAALPLAPARALVCAARAQAGAGLTRRAALAAAAAAAAGALVRGAGAATLTSTKGAKSAMTGDYKTDAAQLLDDMKTAASLVRGQEGMADTVARTRADMNDFVALYRRNGKVSGSTSYSVLYTASNTLSGHYASYGPLYPVPEKRKKRLVQQFTEVERALARGR